MLRSRLAAVAVTIVAASAACTATVAGNRAAAVEPGGAAPPVVVVGSPDPTVVLAPGTAVDCVARLLTALPDQQLAAQVIVVAAPLKGFRSDAVPLLADGAGGVMLTGRTEAGVAATRGFSDALRAVAGRGSRIGPFVAVDQEGGEVQTLKGRGFDTIPSATEQGGLSDGALRVGARKWAQSLHRAGISLDLAPVADVLAPELGPANLSVGQSHRTYGTKPDSVSRSVRAFAGGLRDAGVAATVKHFPGLGAVGPNTDRTGDVLDRAMTATSPALKPFMEAIDDDVPVVMMSSAIYPRLDPSGPAAFSSAIVTGLLRDRLGFSGVVISDDLGNARAVADRDTGQRAVDFVGAGGDLVLSVDPTTAKPMLAALTSRMAADSRFAAQVRASVRRILNLKRELGLLSCG